MPFQDKASSLKINNSSCNTTCQLNVRLKSANSLPLIIVSSDSKVRTTFNLFISVLIMTPVFRKGHNNVGLGIELGGSGDCFKTLKELDKVTSVFLNLGCLSPLASFYIPWERIVLSLAFSRRILVEGYITSVLRLAVLLWICVVYKWVFVGKMQMCHSLFHSLTQLLATFVNYPEHYRSYWMSIKSITKQLVIQ